MIPTKKQKVALSLLTDNTTEFVGYGGAAGGGKSYMGCFWLMQLGYYAAGTKYFIGRDSLKDTRESVLQTWRKLSKEIGFSEWRYNDNHIYFDNGSEIEFLDLTFYPQKDPLYDRLGSKEYTAGWIEEAAPVNHMAFEVLKTRIGRWLNKELNIKKKILCTFNPSKTWVDAAFYRPFKNKLETFDTRFVPAFAKDNPHLPEDYIKTLENLKDKATKERLLFGNFDYDDDPTALIQFDVIEEMFKEKANLSKKYFIVADIARFGSDKTVISVWRGLELIELYHNDYTSTNDITSVITAFKNKYNVSLHNIIADEDGVGGGVVDILNITGFQNGSKPTNSNYNKLKDECGYKLAEVANNISVSAQMAVDIKDLIVQELGMLKTYQTDKDGKLRILPKSEIKHVLMRSPDFLDVFIMRMLPELTTEGQLFNNLKTFSKLPETTPKNSFGYALFSENTCVYIHVKVFEVKNRIAFYIDNVIYSEEPPHVSANDISLQIKKDTPEYCFVKNKLSVSFYRDFKKLAETGTRCSVRTDTLTNNIHSRIVSTSETVNEFCYFLNENNCNESYQKFLIETIRYNKDEALNKGQKVDSPDALTGAIEKIRRILRI